MDIEETNKRESVSQRLDAGVRWRIIGYYESAVASARQQTTSRSINQPSRELFQSSILLMI